VGFSDRKSDDEKGNRLRNEVSDLPAGLVLPGIDP